MSKDKEREEREGVDEKDRGLEACRKKNVAGDSSGCKEIEVSGELRGGCNGVRDGFSMNREGRGGNGSGGSSRTQDVDNSYVPSLSDEIALLILARVPRSEYQKLGFVNHRYRALVRSGELFKIRREIGIKEPCVLMFASGKPHWWSYDPWSGSRRDLPVLPCDQCFLSADKESLSVGTHLLVSGMEIGGPVIWRYELTLDRWFRGPLMINPRCLFASANCGTVACVAGGIGVGPGPEVLDTAEKYDPESKSWILLPRMNFRRKLCSGFYMDGKFYVIGGQNEGGDNLTCGEFLDLERNEWQLVPDMMRDAPNWSSQSPPLVAVVNNELYSLEASSNELKVYLKRSKSWKILGETPVRADHNRGWGVAFKSLGDELVVIGSTGNAHPSRGMMICTCSPNPDSHALRWRVLENHGDQWSSFIYNCSIMMA